MAGVGKSGSPAPRSITSSPAARRRLASWEIAIVADVSRCWRLGENPWAMRQYPHGRCVRARHALPLPRTRASIPPAQRIRPLTIEDRVTTVDEARAALERGRPVVLVTPPAPDQAGALWELTREPRAGAGPSVLIVCADEVAAADWAGAAPA